MHFFVQSRLYTLSHRDITVQVLGLNIFWTDWLFSMAGWERYLSAASYTCIYRAFLKKKKICSSLIMFLSNTSCLFVDVEMSFKIWDTIYPLVNTCKQMNIQIFFMCPVIIPGGCFFCSFFSSHLLLEGVECLINMGVMVSVTVIK